MLHAVSIDSVGDTVHLIADVLVGVVPAASHVRAERVGLPVGKVIIGSCFHIGLVVPGLIILVVRRCRKKHHAAFLRIACNRQGNILRRHLEGEGILSLVIADLRIEDVRRVLRSVGFVLQSCNRNQCILRIVHRKRYCLAGIISSIFMIQLYAKIFSLRNGDLVFPGRLLGFRFGHVFCFFGRCFRFPCSSFRFHRHSCFRRVFRFRSCFQFSLGFCLHSGSRFVSSCFILNSCRLGILNYCCLGYLLYHLHRAEHKEELATLRHRHLVDATVSPDHVDADIIRDILDGILLRIIGNISQVDLRVKPGIVQDDLQHLCLLDRSLHRQPVRILFRDIRHGWFGFCAAVLRSRLFSGLRACMTCAHICRLLCVLRRRICSTVLLNRACLVTGILDNVLCRTGILYCCRLGGTGLWLSRLCPCLQRRICFQPWLQCRIRISIGIPWYFLWCRFRYFNRSQLRFHQQVLFRHKKMSGCLILPLISVFFFFVVQEGQFRDLPGILRPDPDLNLFPCFVSQKDVLHLLFRAHVRIRNIDMVLLRLNDQMLRPGERDTVQNRSLLRLHIFLRTSTRQCHGILRPRVRHRACDARQRHYGRRRKPANLLNDSVRHYSVFLLLFDLMFFLHKKRTVSLRPFHDALFRSFLTCPLRGDSPCNLWRLSSFPIVTSVNSPEKQTSERSLTLPETQPHHKETSYPSPRCPP